MRGKLTLRRFSNPQGVETMSYMWMGTEPYQNLISTRVDFCHQCNLSMLFCCIVLLNAYRIYPDPPLLMRLT